MHRKKCYPRGRDGERLFIMKWLLNLSVRALEAELTEARRVAQEAEVRITEANTRLSAEHERLRD